MPREKEQTAAIAVALISTAGVIISSLISNWSNFHPVKQESAPQPSKTTRPLVNTTSPERQDRPSRTTNHSGDGMPGLSSSNGSDPTVPKSNVHQDSSAVDHFSPAVKKDTGGGKLPQANPDPSPPSEQIIGDNNRNPVQINGSGNNVNVQISQ